MGEFRNRLKTVDVFHGAVMHAGPVFPRLLDRAFAVFEIEREGRGVQKDVKTTVNDVREVRIGVEFLALRQTLAQLPSEPRAALSLHLGAGLSHAETAEALNLPLGTVKSHITRGRARLADLLGAEDD